jgi:hypothetical protein
MTCFAPFYARLLRLIASSWPCREHAPLPENISSMGVRVCLQHQGTSIILPLLFSTCIAPFSTRQQVSGYLLTLAASLMITFVSFVVNQIVADPCKLTNSVAGLSK